MKDYIFSECEKEYEKFPGLYKNPKWFFHVGYFFFEFAIDIVDVFELLTCEDSPLFGEEYQNIIREWNSHNTFKIGSVVKFYNQVYILRYDAFEELLINLIIRWLIFQNLV